MVAFAERAYRSQAGMGRDANGASLSTERRSVLDEAGVTDHRERALWERLWIGADQERGEILAEKLKPED